MDVTAFNVFFGLLTLAGAAVVVVAAGLALLRRRSARARRLAARLADDVGGHALALSTLVAGVSTLGSLFYSEVAGFTPCTLCWYQRVAMYPLVVILAVAVWRRDPGVRAYVLPVVAVGALIAGYHYQLEWFPTQSALACSASVPCTAVWFRVFGFVSLPLMALTGFVLIAGLVLLASREKAPPAETTPTAEKVPTAQP